MCQCVCYLCFVGLGVVHVGFVSLLWGVFGCVRILLMLGRVMRVCNISANLVWGHSLWRRVGWSLVCLYLRLC